MMRLDEKSGVGEVEGGYKGIIICPEGDMKVFTKFQGNSSDSF